MNQLLRPAILIFAVTAASLRAEEPTPSTIKFSHSDKPEVVRIHVAHGSVKVRANDSKETVTVSTTAKSAKKTVHRADGLRVIGASASFTLTENDNVVDINYGVGSGRASSDTAFTITVPPGASLQISDDWGGDITVDGVLGDLEIKNLNGEVMLNDIGGGAVVETMNGEIHATFASFTPGKALSFSSMNGQVELRLPADAKANVRFRTQNGSILTDFAEDVLITKSEPIPSDSALTTETIRTARETRRQAQIAAATDALRAEHEAARQAQLAIADAKEARESRRTTSTDTVDSTPPVLSIPPIPPMPPRIPAIPAVVGGKVLSGTLNGGGVDLQIATMNGDIIVRNSVKNGSDIK